MVDYRIPGWKATRLRETIVPKRNFELFLSHILGAGVAMVWEHRSRLSQMASSSMKTVS